MSLVEFEVQDSGRLSDLKRFEFRFVNTLVAKHIKRRVLPPSSLSESDPLFLLPILVFNRQFSPPPLVFPARSVKHCQHNWMFHNWVSA